MINPTGTGSDALQYAEQRRKEIEQKIRDAMKPELEALWEHIHRLEEYQKQLEKFFKGT